MASREDLYRDLERQEQDEDEFYDQDLSRKAIKKPRRDVNPVKALKTYDAEIRPVLEMRKRISQGLPPTSNPIKNAWLKVTGQDKIVERPGFQAVEPTKDFKPIPSINESDTPSDRG